MLSISFCLSYQASSFQKKPTWLLFDFASHINIALLRYGEHPDERAVKNEEQTEKLAEVMTLTSIYSGLKEKVHKINTVHCSSNIFEKAFFQRNP